MLQAAPMNCPQGPCTFTWREQVLLAAALVADPAHRPVIEGAAREEGAPAGNGLETTAMPWSSGSVSFGPSPEAAAQNRHLVYNPRSTLALGSGSWGPWASTSVNTKK